MTMNYLTGDHVSYVGCLGDWERNRINSSEFVTIGMWIIIYKPEREWGHPPNPPPPLHIHTHTQIPLLLKVIGGAVRYLKETNDWEQLPCHVVMNIRPAVNVRGAVTGRKIPVNVTPEASSKLVLYTWLHVILNLIIIPNLVYTDIFSFYSTPIPTLMWGGAFC